MGNSKNVKKILLIEDDNFIREMYERQLTAEGYAVKSVPDAELAEKEVHATKYDLVLVDIMLPGKNGLDFIKDLHEDDKSGKTSFFMLSNVGQDEVVKQGLDLGAKGYFIKSSYSPQELVHEINSYFQS